MTNPNGNPFGGGGDRNPALSWKDVPDGTTFECKVTDWPTTAQAKDFDSNAPVYWDPAVKGRKTTTPNDNPVKNAIVPVEIGGQPFSIFATLFGDSLFFAIKEAQDNAGKELEPGGILRITLVRRESDPQNPRRQPRKVFSATYHPPAAFGGADPQASAAPAPAAAPQPAAVPAPAAAPAVAPAPAQPAPSPAAAPNPGVAAQQFVSAEQYAALANAGVDMTAFAITPA